MLQMLILGLNLLVLVLDLLVLVLDLLVFVSDLLVLASDLLLLVLDLLLFALCISSHCQILLESRKITIHYIIVMWLASTHTCNYDHVHCLVGAYYT